LWEESFYRFVPRGECSFLRKNITEKLKNVLISIKVDKPESVIWVGDACPRIGSCSGHPGSSHGHLTAFDIDYPLYSGNGTQYANRENKEKIWIKTGLILDESKIDWWVTWQLLIRLKACALNETTHFILHKEIFKLIIKNITKKERDYLYTITSLDEGTRYNHHTHIHIRMKLT